jgi:hypothetical protein
MWHSYKRHLMGCCCCYGYCYVCRPVQMITTSDAARGVPSANITMMVRATFKGKSQALDNANTALASAPCEVSGMCVGMQQLNIRRVYNTVVQAVDLNLTLVSYDPGVLKFTTAYIEDAAAVGNHVVAMTSDKTDPSRGALGSCTTVIEPSNIVSWTCFAVIPLGDTIQLTATALVPSDPDTPLSRTIAVNGKGRVHLGTADLPLLLQLAEGLCFCYVCSVFFACGLPLESRESLPRAEFRAQNPLQQTSPAAVAHPSRPNLIIPVFVLQTGCQPGSGLVGLFCAPCPKGQYSPSGACLNCTTVGTGFTTVGTGSTVCTGESPHLSVQHAHTPVELSGRLSCP